MTDRSQDSPPSADPEALAWAHIDVYCVTDAAGKVVFDRFVARRSVAVDVARDGVIRVRRALMPDAEVVLTFNLEDETDRGLAVEGLQLGVSEGPWDHRPVTLDTEDEYYRDERGHELPFKIANPLGVEPVVTVVLTQHGLLEPSGVNPYFYRIKVQDSSGESFWHDPKIYNEGNGSPPG